MQGSLPRGTMIGGAFPIDLDIQIEAAADDNTINKLVYDAIYASPINGLMREPLSSLFTLSRNGEPVAVGRVAEGEFGGEDIHRCQTCHRNEIPVDTAYYIHHLTSRLQPARPVKQPPLPAGRARPPHHPPARPAPGRSTVGSGPH